MENTYKEYFEMNKLSEGTNWLLFKVRNKKYLQSLSSDMADVIKTSRKGRKWSESLISEMIQTTMSKDDVGLLEDVFRLLNKIYYSDPVIMDEFLIEKYFDGIAFYKAKNDVDNVISLYKMITSTMEFDILLNSRIDGYEHGVMYRMANYYKEFGDYLVEKNQLLEAINNYSESIEWYTVLNEIEDLDIHLCAYYDRIPGLLVNAKDCFEITLDKLSEFELALYRKQMANK